MDHDSVPLEAAKPASSRVADVRSAYADIVRHGLDAMDVHIGRDTSYTSNEHGHFAWDVSLLVRAACLAWRTTGEPSHLAKAVRWGRRLCEGTDSARGVRDWRGRSGPVWSAGSRYTAGIAAIGTIDGREIRVQAAADHVVIDRPSPTTAVVRVRRGSEWTWESPEASLVPGDSTYLPDLLSVRSAMNSVLIRGLQKPADLTAVPAGSYPLQVQQAPHLVHTGLIVRALLTAAEALVDAGEDAPDLDVAPSDLVAAAEAALAFHDGELQYRDDGPWYTTPEDFPGRRLGMTLPHNHVADVVTSHLLLGQHHGDQSRLELARSLAQPFLDEVQRYLDDELSHPWYYYPVDSDVYLGMTRSRPVAERTVRPVPRGEDSSHATLRVRGLAEWNTIDSGLVEEAKMKAVARSFRKDYLSRTHGVPTLRWLPGDSKDAPRRGHSDEYAGAWGALSPWDESLKRRLNELAYHHPPREAFGATLLSAAEILAMNSPKLIYASSGRISPA